MIELISLAARMKELQDQKYGIEQLLKEINAELDTLRKTTIPDLMLSQDTAPVQSIRLNGIGTVYLRHEMYASIIDKFKGHKWLIANGYSNLITETVNASTFKAFAKEQLKLGGTLPEDMFKIEPYVMAVINK